MSQEKWKLFQQIMGIADVIDGLRDWYNYHEVEGHADKQAEIVETINTQISNLEATIARYWEAA